MATVTGVFTDKGREWIAKIMEGSITTTGIKYFRIGEGGFTGSPKVPIPPSDRIDENGLNASLGVKNPSLTIDPDAAPAGDQITVTAVDASDADPLLFFAQKDLTGGDITLSVISGVQTLEVNTVLALNEANETYDSQGAANPAFFEIGIFADGPPDGDFMIGYGTFAEQIKTNLVSLINKIVFEV